jgi:hypothetical protein
MSTTRNALVGAGLAAAVAVPVTLAAAPASADIERTGRCAGAAYELSVDKEHGRFEVEADVDDARPGSRWRVVLRHEGRIVANVVRTADREGDVGVDRYRPDTRGADRFRLTVKPVGAANGCSARIVTR